jgi:4-diphosphocytidyl-2-C-methyl-D-erythritol kinase
MLVTVRSFAKINLGLRIGARRPDGFHELRTVYQTIALHDIIRVRLSRGTGIEILCDDPRVPRDKSNTCYRIAERVMAALYARGRVVIEIEKHLPVQGGLGAASTNAVATLLGLERALKKKLPASKKFQIASEVGSDLPLFLVGGTVLGLGRGEEVYPLPDLPATPCVVATPEIGVSTPQAFADWDEMVSGSPQGLKPLSHDDLFGTAEAVPSAHTKLREGHDFSRAESGQQKASALAAEGTAELRSARTGPRPVPTRASKLTATAPSDRMDEFGRTVSAWLIGTLSGVPVSKGRGRAETPLLDLVRTGIENDFERVVFPKYPELCEVRRVLERAGAFYASLSGSGSAIYGLFASRGAAIKAAARLRLEGIPAEATTTLTRHEYWKKILG